MTLKYEVCHESNEAGPIKIFICRLMKNVHCPLQNSSLKQLYTTGSNASTLGCSVRILLLKLFSVGRLQPKWCPLRWVLIFGEGKRSYGTLIVEPQEYICWPKIHLQRMQRKTLLDMWLFYFRNASLNFDLIK